MDQGTFQEAIAEATFDQRIAYLNQLGDAVRAMRKVTLDMRAVSLNVANSTRVDTGAESFTKANLQADIKAEDGHGISPNLYSQAGALWSAFEDTPS